MAIAIENESPESPRLRMILVEIMIAVGIVLFFFSIILATTNFYLPIGASVKDLAYSTEQSASRAGGRDLEPAQSEQAASGPFTARITQLSNRVSVKLASEIAWSAASTGMSLLYRDALQTDTHAHALVEFDQQSHLDIGENSLVVFQPSESSHLAQQQARSLRLMVEGEISGQLSGSAAGLSSLEVTLPDGNLEMAPAQGSGSNVEFRLNVNQDRSSTVAVQQGGAQLLIGGKRIELKPNQGLTIDANGHPMQVVPLPPAPDLKLPTDGSAAYYRDLPPEIVFSWTPSPSAAAYRFMLARDPGFQQVVVDERVKRTTFAYGNLKQGRYYWRVHSLVGGLQGAPSEARSVTTVQDREPPMLRLQPAPKVVYRNNVRLSGQTEPGAKVSIEGQPVRVDSNGYFEHRVRIKPGASLIVIEATDPAGNITYATELVNGKF